MVNRELIRIKVVQIVYSYYGRGDNAIGNAEKELLLSLSKAYELYNSMLSLMVSITHMGERMVEMRQNRASRLGDKEVISRKFVENRFIGQLRKNEQLKDFLDHQNVVWDDDELLRNIYNKITEQDFYQDYMKSGENSYEEDRNLWRNIYRNILCNNDDIDEVLEEHSLYWNDDKVVVDTFVIKTIRQFDESKGGKQPLLPKFKSDDDQKFAVMLFRAAIKNDEYYHLLISAQTYNWDIERIARMDLIIMQIALAEIINFPEIPVVVSINEYVELAKLYSTPRSGAYINGILDTIVKQLQKEGIVTK